MPETTDYTGQARKCAGKAQEITRQLCRWSTTVVGGENEQYFDYLQSILPVTISRFASGQAHNGWEIPQAWTVHKALLKKDGKVVYDGGAHHLGMAMYSKSFSGPLSREALEAHIACSNPSPDNHLYHCRWLYQPWKADWAFTMPKSTRDALGSGDYEVEIETHYAPGEMLVAECVHKGESNQTIVLNAHTCHPRMANDGNAGVALLAALFQAISTRKTKYTYKLVLAPEHFGTVYHLKDMSPGELNNYVGGFFVEMPSTKGPLKIASSFLGEQLVDRAALKATRDCGLDHLQVPWRTGAGNDETVWEAPGYEVPFVELTRCEDQFAPFKGYHTDADDADSILTEDMETFAEMLLRTVDILETDVTLHRHFDGLICLSNPEYDLYKERTDANLDKGLEDDSEKWGHLLDSLLRYFDGKTTVLDIAEKHDLPYDELLTYLRTFQAKGLISMRPTKASRAPITPRGVK